MTARQRRVDRATFACLCVLAASLPFELREPLFRIGPILVTNVELVLYATVGVAACGWLIRDRHASPTTLPHVAVLVWIGVLGMSALTAPAGRADAIKFALRSTGGCLVFVAAARSVRTVERSALLIAALAAGAAISAAVGALEVWAPATGTNLLAFHPQRSHLGGFVRASGTFDQANTAAMYWEAVLVLMVAGGAWLE